MKNEHVGKNLNKQMKKKLKDTSCVSLKALTYRALETTSLFLVSLFFLFFSFTSMSELSYVGLLLAGYFLKVFFHLVGFGQRTQTHSSVWGKWTKITTSKIMHRDGKEFSTSLEKHNTAVLWSRLATRSKGIKFQLNATASTKQKLCRIQIFKTGAP